MRKFIYLLLIILINQLLVFSSPQTLYDQVYKIVDDNYFDVTSANDNYKDWQNKYDNKLKTYEDAYIAIETFIESVSDGYTRFMRPQMYDMVNQIISNEYDGYGLTLIQKRVIRIFPVKNSQAEHAGIKNNDILVKINGVSVKGKTLDEICEMIDLISPKPLVLDIKRKGEFNTITVNRGKIVETSVVQETPFKTKIPSNIGYFRIISFSDKHVSKDFYKLMKENTDKDAYIIDLRDNGGGIVKYAAEVANMLLQNKVIFTMLYPKGEKQKFDANEHILTDKPIVLLINSGSASASEILAGALQENGRAIIVGEKSFGKGIMQKRYDLENDCGITVTVCKYLTPKNNYIHKKGIIPDEKIKHSNFDTLLHNDKQLKKALMLLENKI